jgi:hypothetical protein
MGIRTWWQRKFGKDVSAFSDDQKIEAYYLAGCEIGNAASYVYMGECVGFDKLLDQWEVTERAYSALGFRALSIDDFIRCGGWGHDIDHLMRVPRKEGEPEVFHAAYYREHFMGMSNAVTRALHAVPTTEHLKQG